MNKFLTSSLFTCLTFEKQKRTIKTVGLQIKGGDTLTKIHETEAPCPDYGFLGYFINVRNLPGDTGGVGHEKLQLDPLFLGQERFSFSSVRRGMSECLTKT